ncbi:MAG: cation diffusion facilitator family transporter, partial [Actinobacteria bacterium]|nr:cation diffusion facilitator family transporter [Actinomycetota bacterium]MBM3712845.1 cation diffusion facilitator family transporter [Actinomycetota bacterium]
MQGKLKDNQEKDNQKINRGCRRLADLITNNRDKLTKKRIALFSLLVSIFLIAVKIIIAYLTNSLGVYSEVLNNGLDLVLVLITYIAIRASIKPADKDHTYGHGKYENFSALFELTIISLLSFFIIYKSIQRIIYKNFELNLV